MQFQKTSKHPALKKYNNNNNINNHGIVYILLILELCNNMLSLLFKESLNEAVGQQTTFRDAVIAQLLEQNGCWTR